MIKDNFAIETSGSEKTMCWGPLGADDSVIMGGDGRHATQRTRHFRSPGGYAGGCGAGRGGIASGDAGSNVAEIGTRFVECHQPNSVAKRRTNETSVR